MEYPQAYAVPPQSRVGKMPALTRENLAGKFRQNWMVKFPYDTYCNGATNLDNSLTSLNWLQNLNNTKKTSPTPPPSTVTFGFYANNEIRNMYYRLANPSWQPQNSIRHNLSQNKCFQKVPKQTDESGKGGFRRINPDYNDMIDNGVSKKRHNSQEGLVPPPLKKIKKVQEDDYFPSCNNNSSSNESVVHFSNEEQKSLKDDFNWTSVLHQDIEIGGINIKTDDLLDGLDSLSSVPSDTMSPQSDTMNPQSSDCISDNFSIEDLFAQTDLLQDISFDLTSNDPLVPSDTMSPKSSDCSSDNFSIEDLFAQTDLSQDIQFDYTSNDPLVLTLNGSYLSPPANWWSEVLNAGEQVEVKHNTKKCSGLHMPIVSSPVQEHDNLDGHPWADSITFADIAEAFNVDNLFDLENIPKLS